MSYEELSEALELCPPADVHTKQLLTAMMWAMGESQEERRGRPGGAQKIDTSRWTLEGKDLKSVRAELQVLLRNSGAYIADLIKVCARTGLSHP